MQGYTHTHRHWSIVRHMMVNNTGAHVSAYHIHIRSGHWPWTGTELGGASLRSHCVTVFFLVKVVAQWKTELPCPFLMLNWPLFGSLIQEECVFLSPSFASLFSKLWGSMRAWKRSWNTRMPWTLDHKYLVGTVRHGVWEDVTQPCRIIHMCSPLLHLCGNADRIWNLNPGKLLRSFFLKDSHEFSDGWSQVTDLGQSMPTRWWCFIILICSKKGHRVGRCALVWLLATTNMWYNCINIYIYMHWFICLNHNAYAHMLLHMQIYANVKLS